MKGWSGFDIGLLGLLNQQQRLQKVLNYRAAVGAEKHKRKALMIQSIGLATWEDLLIYYGGFSDDVLERTLKMISDDIELRLCRHYLPS